MKFEPFDQASIAHHHNGNAAQGQEYPAHLASILGESDFATATSVIRQWSGYQPTQLHSLNSLARDIGIANVFYKDEGSRFGLGSFKALGGSYAVLRLLSEEIAKITGQPASDADISTGKYADIVKNLMVITATDGNHGRSVAWGAQQFGCPCKIYMHPGVSQGRAKAVEAFGAEVVWCEGNYDDSVAQASRDALANDWFVVSDNSYEGYLERPRDVMAGYSVMTSEIISQLPEQRPPSHVFVQGGCGGLAAAVCAHLWHSYGKDRPRFIIVEPDKADCIYQSAVQGRMIDVNITDETIMAGLSCGKVSLLAWDIIKKATDDVLVIGDELVGPTMRLLANGESDQPVVAGESAVAGLAGLIAATRMPNLKHALGLDEQSSVLIIGTEGATDPEIYLSIVGRHPEEVV